MNIFKFNNYHLFLDIDIPDIALYDNIIKQIIKPQINYKIGLFISDFYLIKTPCIYFPDLHKCICLYSTDLNDTQNFIDWLVLSPYNIYFNI